jgi:CheY-like chemotaxis protein
MNAAGVSGAAAPLPPKVLIVEDDVLIRAATSQFLRGTGFTVLEAVDADQALELLRTEGIVIVFADVKLPGPKSGIDLVRIVQTDFPNGQGAADQRRCGGRRSDFGRRDAAEEALFPVRARAPAAAFAAPGGLGTKPP